MVRARARVIAICKIVCYNLRVGTKGVRVVNTRGVVQIAMRFFWRISAITLLLMSGWNGVIAAELCSLLQSCAPVSQTESVAVAEIVESRSCCAHDRSSESPAAHRASEAQSNAPSPEPDTTANHSGDELNIHAPGTETPSSCTHCAGRGNLPAPPRIISQTSAAKPETVGDDNAPALASLVASTRSPASTIVPSQSVPLEHARPKHLLISVFRI